MKSAEELTASQERWRAAFHAHCAELRFSVKRLADHLADHGDLRALELFADLNDKLLEDRQAIKRGLEAAGYQVDP